LSKGKKDRRLFVDVSRVDLQVVSATGEQLGSPLLITLIDVYSRLVVGFAFVPPSGSAMKKNTRR